MNTEFCLEALTDALVNFGGAEIFNTDQGSQFTSIAFTSALQDAGMRCSMDVIAEWIDYYNEERLHSALAGRTPAEAYRDGMADSTREVA